MVAARVRKGIAQLGFEQRAICQTGQKVMVGLVREPQVQLPPLGHVLNQRERKVRAVAWQRMGRDVDEEQAAIALAMLFNGIFGLYPAQLLGDEVGFDRRGDVRKRHGEELLAGVAVLGDGRIVHAFEGMRLTVVNPHGMRIGFKEHRDSVCWRGLRR